MKTTICVAFLLIGLPLTNALGQKPEQEDGPVGIFQSQAEYNQFMGNAKRLAYGDEGSDELQAMIPMLNDIALDRPVGWTANQYNTNVSDMGLLSDRRVRDDIEMVDDQYNQLQDLSSQIQKRAAEQLRSLDFTDRDNLVKQIRRIRDEASAELNAVLLPHQVDRLKQIRMQSELRRRSLVDILTSDPMKSELNITDRQSDELRKREQEIEKELEQEIAKLREKARDKLISTLNANQKAEVTELIGDAFEFSESGNKANSNGKTKKGEGKSNLK